MNVFNLNFFKLKGKGTFVHAMHKAGGVGDSVLWMRDEAFL